METLESISALFGFGAEKALQPPRFAKVTAVSGDAVTVKVGTDSAEAVRCCACAAGDVVLLETLPNGTLAAVATRGASGGGSVPQNLTYYGTCSTAAGTSAKVVTCSGFVLATGATIHVLFSTAQTATSMTLNVNMTGAKNAYLLASSIAPTWSNTGQTATFTYNGTNWVCVSVSGVSYATGSRLGSANTTSSADGRMQHILATGSMGTGKPVANSNGHIIDMGWDNTGNYGAQLYLPNAQSTAPAWRGQAGSSTWATMAWDPFYTHAFPPATDEISGTYTDGIWTVRKWADGTAECWGEYTWNITSWGAWGSWYYSNATGSVPYPSGLFIAPPIEVANAFMRGGEASMYIRGGDPVSTGTKDYVLMRPSAGSTSTVGYLRIQAMGRWRA